MGKVRKKGNGKVREKEDMLMGKLKASEIWNFTSKRIGKGMVRESKRKSKRIYLC